jgi:hypothetical protein
MLLGTIGLGASAPLFALLGSGVIMRRRGEATVIVNDREGTITQIVSHDQEARPLRLQPGDRVVAGDYDELTRTTPWVGDRYLTAGLI